MIEPPAAVSRVPTEPTPATSFEDFFEAEHRILFRRMCLVTRSASEAEELMQDAFTNLWQRWDRVAVMADPTGYLYRTAMNLFRSRYRRTIVAAKRNFRTEPRPDDLALAETRSAVAAALGSLSPRQRAALVLTDLIGFSSEEAAQMLGIRPSTVRALASQGRSAIRRSQLEKDLR